MKTIRIDATSRQSVRDAIAELQTVKKEWYEKAKRAENEVAAKLADLISENLSKIPYSDDLIDVKTHTETPLFPIMGAMAVGNRVYIKGEEIAFVEFGAGIYHNAGTNNPLSEKVQFDTAIGSYGKGQGNKNYWFVAHNLISRGTPAYMPIYNAIESLRPMIPTIVRQVFL